MIIVDKVNTCKKASAGVENSNYPVGCIARVNNVY